MKRTLVLTTVVGIACLLSCATLPEIGAGVCGNGIVEPGEDCDSFPRDKRDKGTVCEACHFKCTASAAGTDNGSVCPTGWSCAPSDGTCRAASGQYRALTDTPSDAFRVDVADVDGDLVGDIVATSTGQTRVHFAVDTLANTFEIPSLGRAPAIAQLTADARADLLFSSREVSVWRGQADRTLSPTAYPAIFLPKDVVARIATADAYVDLPGDEVFVFGAFDPTQAKATIALRSGIRFVPLQTMRGNASDIAGEIQVGDIREGDGACPEIAFAFLGNDGIDVFHPCDFVPSAAAPPTDAPAPRLRLKPIPDNEDQRLSVGPGGLLLADLNGDDHLDLLIDVTVGESERRVFGALGVGNGHFKAIVANGDPGEDDVAVILPKTFDDVFFDLGQYHFPHAAGQLGKTDKLGDFIFDDHALMRTPSGPDDAGDGKTVNTRLDGPADHLWTEARIGDFNGDGSPDFAAVSARGLDFYAGSDRPPLMNLVSYSVLSGASHLGVGDFDGDHAQDFAFASSDNDLFVAFGSFQSGPGEPESMGRFPGIRQVTTGVIKIATETPDALSDIGIMGATDTAQLVSIVRGSTDRRLLSPYQLTRIDDQQRLLQSATITAAAGRFDADPHLDLAILGVGLRPEESGILPLGTSLWLVPSTGEAELSTQATEGLTLQQATGDPEPFDWSAASMVALDLDAPSADPRDELVLVAPPRLVTNAGEEPVLKAGRLLVARLSGNTWTQQTAIDLGGKAPSVINWRVRAVDVDGDGAKDIAVLNEDSGTSKVTVFFNTGDGRLDAAPVSVSFPDMAIVDCAWIQADDKPGKELAVLTREPAALSQPVANGQRAGVYLVPASGRTFQAPRVLVQAGGDVGDSIAAGDVDGDGVDDLVVQRSGSLRVFQGIPAVPR